LASSARRSREKKHVRTSFKRCSLRTAYVVSRHTFSDILRDTLDLWDLPHTRDHLQKIAIVMNAQMGFGDGVLSHAMRRRIMNDTADVTILDGVRWLGDEKMIHGPGGRRDKSIMSTFLRTQKCAMPGFVAPKPRRRGRNDMGGILAPGTGADRSGHPAIGQPRRARAENNETT